MKNLKLIIISIIALSAIIFFMSSCSSEVNIDKELLTGKWQSTIYKGADKTTVFYRYNADGTGLTWDIADDVTEEEAQPFDWTLEEDVLTQIHKGEMGQNIPKPYIITQLDEMTLSYHDEVEKKKVYTFSRVNE